MTTVLIPPPGYVEHLHALRRVFLKWRSENGDKTAKIQFNFPKNVAVAATIRDAIKLGFVSCNEAGIELIEAMCKAGPCDPTVIMVRVVIEIQQDLKA